ncbi:MAG: hypothetical protein KF882_02860 [Bacteroidia bacterium]|nr:hypothetical protein [Bacteroidia bacterium]MCO5253743.1 hypothetical protein [Bacteroidota bacterium]
MIISVDNIPDELGFIQEGISNVFSKLFFKQLYVHNIGGNSEYSFILVSKSKIAIDISKGEDIILVVNPGYSSGSPSEFDVSARYRWILKERIGSFELDTFDHSPSAFLDIIIRVFGIDTSAIFQSAIFAFYHEEDYEDDPLQQFVEYFNIHYSPDTDLTLSSHDSLNEIIEDLLTQMKTGGNDYDPFTVIFDLYIDSGETLEEKLANIELLFRNFFGDFTLASFKQILFPQFSVSFHGLNIALEFPRSLLIPLNSNNDRIDDEKSKLTFTVGSLNFDSDIGFSFNEESEFTLDKSEILESGFVLDADGIKLYLSNGQNLQNAQADGRTEFKGIYIEEATIGLPKDWTADPNNQNIEIKGKELLIGTGGGFSGKIGVEGNGKLKFSLLGIDIDFSSFYVEFKQNAVISSDIKGKLTIEGLKDSKGNNAVLDFTIDWKADGYTIKIENTNGIQLRVPNVVDITLYSLSIGRVGGNRHFKSKGKIDRVADIPQLGVLIPRTLDFKKIEINQGAANDYDIDIKWEDDITATFNENGLDLDYEHIFPINKTVLKIFTLHLIKFQVKSNRSNGIDITTLIDADLNLDPIFGTIRGGGLKAAITFPEDGGNLGPADIQFSLVTPDSMGIQIKIPGIKGGGWLRQDENEEEYTGLLHLEIQDKLKINAYGILNLRLPSGKAGFSIVGIASVEFTPAIDIAMGLKLGGIGVLFGLNRSMDITALQDSVRDNTLQHLMFPEKPVENASTIISTMGKVFPVNEGQFTFGLLLKAYWGGEKLVTLTMGIMVEVKNPVKIAVAGVLTLSLPDEKNPLVLINAAFLAAVDFDAKKFALDARIYDSKIMNLSISGDILARYYWGDTGGFLLSMGGFHPSYMPPQLDLPAKINRLAISFIDEADRKLKGEFYMAISSNSVQFGAALDLYVKLALGYSLKGRFGLDVLMYTRPEFWFLAEMHVSAGVYRKSKNKPAAGISIDLSLQGPNPYHAKGRGSVSIGPLEISGNFDITVGKKRQIVASSVNVFAMVEAQIKDSYTWQSVLPDLNTIDVTLRELKTEDLSEGVLMLHPMGCLQVKQGVAPLNISLNCFGNATIEDDDKIWIQSAKIGATTLPSTPVRDKFAPAQFFNITEDQKLKSPAFSDYQAGVEIGGTDAADTCCIRIKDINHRTIVLDKMFVVERGLTPVTSSRFNDSMLGGATASSPASQAKTTVHGFIGSEESVQYEADSFVLLFAEDHSEASPNVFSTYEEALETLRFRAVELDVYDSELLIARQSETVVS